MPYAVELGSETDETLVELTGHDITTVDVKLTHTQLADWTIETHHDPSLTNYADVFAPMTLYWVDPVTEEREVLFHGQVVKHVRKNAGPGSQARSVLEGHCRAFSNLRRSAPVEIITYEDITARDAIEDYWLVYTPFQATVHEQPLERLPPIDSVELTDDHLTNLQKLHERANFVFSIDHNSPALEVTSMSRGSFSRSASWEIDGRAETEALSVEHDDDRRDYANIVIARGAHDEEHGGRLRWDAVNGNEINRLRDKGCPPGKSCAVAKVSDPDAETLGEVQTMAETELARRVEAGKTKGTLDVIPTWVQPGFSYDVEALDEENLLLETVNYTFGGRNETASLEFSDYFGYARDVATLRGQVSRIVNTL